MIRRDFPPLTLDQSSPLPIFRQLYSRIAEAVLAGRLAPGARLPSARSLAAQLSVARGTVEAAYQLLAGEGYVVTRGAAGTLVDPALDRKVLRPRPQARDASPEPRPEAAGRPAGAPGLFQLGLPALDAFPYKIWARLLARQARALGPADLTYQPSAGRWDLRVQIARYLAVARGVACDPAQIFITNGYQGALGLITRVLMRPGDAIFVEHPGYPIGRHAMQVAGMRPVGVSVDEEGFDISAAEAGRRTVRCALVTPTHEYPLGVTLSLQRRMALLAWAEQTEGWIIEDDYDAEFRYHGRPLPALKSLDRLGRVLFVGTFSKVLSPGLRVGYLVVPSDLVQRFTEMAAGLQPPPAAVVQAAIAAFIDEGYLARHIRRMRLLYAERRSALAAALQDATGAALEIELQSGGMHLLGRLPRGCRDRQLATELNRRGIAVSPLSTCGVERPYAAGLLLGFTNIAAKNAVDAARRLADGLVRVRNPGRALGGLAAGGTLP